MKNIIEFHAAGVTFNNRQKMLGYLIKHPDAKIVLCREPDNKHDKNAIKILAKTDRRVNVGYVPKILAEKLAPLMDSKTFIHIDQFQIIGSYHSNYGMKLKASY